MFSEEPEWTHLLQHDIKTPPGVVVHQQLYQVPEAHCQATEAEVAQMLHNGIIEESTSPWSSPVVIVPKPDRSLNLCKDFSNIHEMSELDGYSTPTVDELKYLGRFISTLDLTKGY